MYTPRAFCETDLRLLDELIERDPFITLITRDEQGLPCISQLPVLMQRDAERIRVEGHWARANPQSQHQGEALILVRGPHCYISPGWYPDKETAARVPTWNYSSAELHGELVRFDDTDALADLVARLSSRFEPTVGNEWRFEPERDDHRRQLRGIIGFRIDVERMQLKAKFSQNHPPANVRSAIDALETLGGEQRRDVATSMRHYLAQRADLEN